MPSGICPAAGGPAFGSPDFLIVQDGAKRPTVVVILGKVHRRSNPIRRDTIVYRDNKPVIVETGFEELVLVERKERADAANVGAPSAGQPAESAA